MHLLVVVRAYSFYSGVCSTADRSAVSGLFRTRILTSSIWDVFVVSTGTPRSGTSTLLDMSSCGDGPKERSRQVG